MKKLSFEIELHELFDSELGGSRAQIEIDYDVDNIIENDFNEKNLVLVSVTSEDPYLLNSLYDFDKVMEEIKGRISDTDTLSSIFAERVCQRDYDMIFA